MPHRELAPTGFFGVSCSSHPIRGTRPTLTSVLPGEGLKLGDISQSEEEVAFAAADLGEG